MTHLKTQEEIQKMKEGGKILMEVVDAVVPLVKPGMTTAEVDRMAEKEILARGGTVSFKTVSGFNWATCLPVNEQIVHTPPSDRILEDGDVLTFDIGVLYKGFHTDYATAFIVGKSKDSKIETFLRVGEETLEKAIQAARPGGYIGEISKVIEDEIYGHGYHILNELTGHGIGIELHEAPYVPGYLDRPIEKTEKIQAGLAIAVEVIYSFGTEDIAHEPDNSWSIITKDKSISACFERTIAFSDKNRFILT